MATCGGIRLPSRPHPGFDRVASNGVLFTHAFCAASQCSISRATLLAGRNPWQLEEAGVQGSLFPAKYSLYTDLLAADGYHVGYTGKPWAPGSWQADGRHSDPCGEAYNKRLLRPPTSKVSAIDYSANFDDFLRDRPDGSPFCFWFGCYEPHRDYEDGSGRRSGMNAGDVPVPPSLPDNPTVRSDLLDYFLEIEWFDQPRANSTPIRTALEGRGTRRFRGGKSRDGVWQTARISCL